MVGKDEGALLRGVRTGDERGKGLSMVSARAVVLPLPLSLQLFDGATGPVFLSYRASERGEMTGNALFCALVFRLILSPPILLPLLLNFGIKGSGSSELESDITSVVGFTISFTVWDRDRGWLVFSCEDCTLRCGTV